MLKQKLLIALITVGFVGGGFYSLALNKAKEASLFEMKIEKVKIATIKPKAIEKSPAPKVAKEPPIPQAAPRTASVIEAIAPKAEVPVLPQQNAPAPDPVIVPENATAEAPVAEPAPVVQPAPTPQPEPIRVFIAEIMFDAVGSDEGKEFIKLFNPTNSDINLENWSLKNGATSLVKIGSKNEDALVIKAQSYLTIGFYNNPMGEVVRSTQLPNSVANIRLTTDLSELMDEASYDGSMLDEGVAWQRPS